MRPLMYGGLFLLSVLIGFTGGSLAQTYPQDTQYNGPLSQPSLSRPGYLQTVVDPVFGTNITRISDESAFGCSGWCLQHLYAKNQPWNSTMTMIKLMNCAVFLDAVDFHVIRNTGGLGMCVWSYNDPNVVYYTSGNQFRKYNPVTNTSTLVRSFSQGSLSPLGQWEGNISHTGPPNYIDKYVALTVGTTYVIIYDIQLDTIVAEGRIPSYDWQSVDQSGQYLLLGGGTSGGTDIRQYTITLSFIRQLMPTHNHGDTGYDQAGNPAWIETCPQRFARLDTGAVTAMLNGIWDCGHMSSRNYKRPGWALKSGDGELYAAKVDASNIVERFAHERSSKCNYDAYPKGVLSPDGSKVMWNSDWGTCGNTVYAYVAEMPGNKGGGGDVTAPAAPKGLLVK